MTSARTRPPELAAPMAHLRPRLGLADVAVHLWRAKWLILLVFLPLFALGLFAALALPERYTAHARLIVSAAEFSAGAAEAETELMRSPAVIGAALERVTLARAWPEIAGGCEGQACARLGGEALRRAFRAEAASGGRAISASLTHADPSMAAELLNVALEAYLDYRPAILGEEPALNFNAQRERFEQEVVRAEAAIRDYLAQNGLGGLDTERASLAVLHAAANAQLLSAATRRAEVTAELAVWRRRLAAEPAEQVLYIEDTSRQRLQALQMEREELRARLAPHDPVLRDLDWRIERLETYLQSQTPPEGFVRRGGNPLWEEARSAIARLEAEASAIDRQQTELQMQLASIEERQMRLMTLTPGLEDLQRRRDAAAEGARRFARLAAEARARTDLSRDGGGDVRLMAPAEVPVRGESLRGQAALGALLLALVAALGAGLAHALTRPGFATPRALERTIGVPVLATVRRH